jgi:hypothetical protein
VFQGQNTILVSSDATQCKTADATVAIDEMIASYEMDGVFSIAIDDRRI